MARRTVETWLRLGRLTTIAAGFEIVLDGMAEGISFEELVAAVRPCHPERDTFPGEVFLALAADALAIASISRATPVAVADVTKQWPFHVAGRSDRAKTDYVVRAVAMIHAGVEPDLLEETGWWHVDDLWLHSLAALLSYMAMAASRTDSTVSVVCDRLRHPPAHP